jgi:hypothetical protein
MLAATPPGREFAILPKATFKTEYDVSALRLGDEIDDYCVKCRRITNHLIVSLLNGEPAKVRCRSCYSDHDYRHETVPPSKKDLKKGQLFKEVLSSIDPTAKDQPAGSGQKGK